MSGSGIGRGRGWLNINKSQTVKPGSVPSMNTANNDYDDTITITSGPKLNPKYSNVLTKLNYFDENDDGILLNQKLKHIIEELNNTCHSASDVEECFNNIHENCLHNAEFASKTIGVVTTVSFHTLTIQDVKFRNLLLSQFQKNFESCKQLQTGNPSQFRITVKMLGDYFHKARLRDGQQIKFLSSPMLQYLNMLLESSSDIDLELFTVQLFMNGNEIKEECATQLSQMLIQVRKMLAHNDKLSSISKLWLMLALDISNNRYALLPKDINQFYVTQLGDEAMSHIKKLNTELSIQISYQNMKLDSHQSNVNVLQKVQNKQKKTNNWESPKSKDEKSIESHQKFNASHSFNVPSSEVSFNNIGTWEQPKQEKAPRPILGVGARLKQEENKIENEWNDTPSAGWDNKKKDEGNWGNKPRKSVSKGWEHDDRLEADYN